MLLARTVSRFVRSTLLSLGTTLQPGIWVEIASSRVTLSLANVTSFLLRTSWTVMIRLKDDEDAGRSSIVCLTSGPYLSWSDIWTFEVQPVAAIADTTQANKRFLYMNCILLCFVNVSDNQ